MGREEQILSEAKKHYYDSINCHNAFLHGVEWADEHPANVWHDASEKPILHKPILIQCGYPLHTYETTALSEDVIWGDFVVLNAIFRWAYISDLLPKGGEQ